LLGATLLALTSCKPPAEEIQPASRADAPVTSLTYHALVIGISDYNRTGWPQLGTARADAEAVGNVLRDQYDFQVTELMDKQATQGNILRALDQLMQLGPHDALLIYFAGHGFYDSSMDEGYWIPYGAQRSRMDQPAKEDWLWNSSISRIIGASPARHILLIADTCYGGSLFRGADEPDRSARWYQRAMNVPSRYLITSGNLEPVLDSGIRHSIFAQEILNALQYEERDIFSASDLAVSIRTQVSQLTGQLVRMGPLNTPAHAGGEFVFMRKGSERTVDNPEIPDAPTFRSAEAPSPLEQLADRLHQSPAIRPRVLACLGPVGSNPDETALVRTRLYEHLNLLSGTILVEREAFDSILQEVELGSSQMADQRAATEIGKLLPASLILFGNIIPIDGGKEIHLRVVDTETSRVLSSASAAFTTPADMATACQHLAGQITQTIHQNRPVLLPARASGDGTLEASWGRFHGARIGDTFAILSREALDTIAPKETTRGTAQILSIGEEQAIFQATWNASEAPPPATLWLKATH